MQIKVWTLKVRDNNGEDLSVHGSEADAMEAAWTAVNVAISGFSDKLRSKVENRQDVGDLDGAVEAINDCWNFKLEMADHDIDVPGLVAA